MGKKGFVGFKFYLLYMDLTLFFTTRINSSFLQKCPFCEGSTHCCSCEEYLNQCHQYKPPTKVRHVKKEHLKANERTSVSIGANS